MPEGVTLDLTTDGARLFLKDGATLTVNGTINARGHGDQGRGWVDGSIFIEDGASVINGSGTINLKNKGRLLVISIWGDRDGCKLTLDGVTLTGLADNNDSLVVVEHGGELIMEGGSISNNTADSGGGVFVVDNSSFIMKGGTISGNTSHQGGGGVGTRNAGFIMEGGTIYDSAGNLPAGTNARLANTCREEAGASVLSNWLGSTARWGTGGTYTIGGVSQTSGSVIGSTNDTLIAIPAQ